ncbi:AbrB/MazE/SpoVT family DNA-binding domain-containing protein [Candidatus Nitrosocosmicus sp. R]
MVEPIFRKIQSIDSEQRFLIDLPKEFAKKLQLRKGDYVSVYQLDEKIIIESASYGTNDRYEYTRFLNTKNPKKFNKPDKKSNDIYTENDEIDYWTNETIITYCTNQLREILQNSSQNQELVILLRFLSICNCVDKIEFSEKIIDPILNKICIQFDLDYEEVKNNVMVEIEEEF